MLNGITRRMPCTERFLRWVLPRSIIVGAVLFGCIIFLGYTPRVHTGTVEYKVVTGSNEQGSHVLIMQTGDKVFMLADLKEGKAKHDERSVNVSKGLDEELNRCYDDVDFRISVRLHERSLASVFSVSRDVFNDVKANEEIVFEIGTPRSTVIKRIVENASSRIQTGWMPSPEHLGPRQYMAQ